METVEQLEGRLDLVEKQIREGHYCVQQKEIGQILGILTNLVKEFYGNGSEGISKTVPKLDVKISTLIETASINRTAISALAKSFEGLNAVEVHKEKEKLNSKQRTAILVSAIVGGSGVIIALVSLIKQFA